MDDLKLFGKNEREIESLVTGISEDMGMEFGLRKCGVLRLKKGKVTGFA